MEVLLLALIGAGVVMVLLAKVVTAAPALPGDDDLPDALLDDLPEDRSGDEALPWEVLQHPLAAVAAGLGFAWTAAAFRSLRQGRMVTMRPSGGGFSLSVACGASEWRLDPRRLDDSSDRPLTGDAAFDDMFRVSGDPVVALSALSLEARERLRGLGPAASLQCADEQLMLEMPLMPKRQVFAGTVDTIVAMAACTGEHARCVAQLLARLDEEEPGPRREALAAVLSDRRSGQGMRRLAAARVSDTDPPSLKVLAAEVGLSVRWDWVAPVAADEGLPVPLRVRAVKAAQFIGEGHECAALGEALLASMDLSTLDEERGDAALVAAAAGLALRARAPLPEALEERLAVGVGFLPDGEQVQLLEALGARGTIRSVAPLKVLSARWLSSGVVRRAAADAVDAIQSRLVNAEPGALSLSASEDGGGAVSLTDEAASGRDGAVTLADSDERD